MKFQMSTWSPQRESGKPAIGTYEQKEIYVVVNVTSPCPEYRPVEHLRVLSVVPELALAGSLAIPAILSGSSSQSACSQRGQRVAELFRYTAYSFLSACQFFSVTTRAAPDLRCTF